ncbi:hypothetical protein QOT17_020200 [Balamuthia mandrillaris]
MLQCPVCSVYMDLSEVAMDKHVEECLSLTMIAEEQQQQACANCGSYHDSSALNEARLCPSCANARSSSQSRNRSTRPVRQSSLEPFRVYCPYPFCPAPAVQAKDFPSHVKAAHSLENAHNFACPLCELLLGSSLHVDEIDNLFRHCNSRHKELIAASSYTESTFDTASRPSFAFSSSSSSTTSSSHSSTTTQAPPLPSALPSSPSPITFTAPTLVSMPSTTASVSATLPRRPTPTTAATPTQTPASTSSTRRVTSIDRKVVKLPFRPGSRFVESTLATDMLVSSGKHKKCPICYERLQTGQQIATMECFCTFHVKCLRAWFQQPIAKDRCPLHKED